MYKFYLISTLLCLSSLAGYAVPASTEPYQVELPDGSHLTVMLHGDEYANYLTTIDGYEIVMDKTGFYYYKSPNSIANMKAHEPNERSSDEVVYLASLNEFKSGQANYYTNLSRTERSGRLQLPKIQSNLKSNFRGLVILVEYNDTPFSRDDIHEIFTDMLNARNYKGFKSVDSTVNFEYTGSVYDYFNECSNGIFQPEFDVVGPVKVNYSSLYPKQTRNSQEVFKAALQAIDNDVDFSLYDCNGDGEIDLLYFIVSGAGSNYSGNNTKLLWPHATVMTGVSLDGVKASSMACSTELYGLANNKVIDGIGVICHEFSHVLGLPDLYDVDYAGSGGQNIHPNSWMIMAGGAYFNKSRTPCAYSAFERMYAGFINPTELNASGHYTLANIHESNKCYRISTLIPNEYFILENRQQSRWDEYLPGSGMLVYHVDMTDMSPWNYNKVNVNPQHPYLSLVRADDQSSSASIKDTASDPFPGSTGVTSLDNTTSPSLLSWGEIPCPFTLYNISETDGEVSFQVKDEAIATIVEDFESFPITQSSSTPLCINGSFCKWNLTDVGVDKGLDEGKSLIFSKGGTATATDAAYGISCISFELYNNAAVPAIMKAYYSSDNENWQIIRTRDDIENLMVSKAETSKSFVLAVDAPVNERGSLKFEVISGKSTNACMLDNLTLFADRNNASEARSITDTGLNHFHISCSGGILCVYTSDTETPVELYSLEGIKIASEYSDSQKATFSGLQHGIYIVRQNSTINKIIL